MLPRLEHSPRLTGSGWSRDDELPKAAQFLSSLTFIDALEVLLLATKPVTTWKSAGTVDYILLITGRKMQ